MRLLSQKICVGGDTNCLNGPLSPDLNTIGDVVNKLIQFIMPIALIILFFVFAWGGIEFLMSQGNAEKVKGAQAKLTTGMIGFILLITAFFVVRLLSWLFGLGEGIL